MLEERCEKASMLTRSDRGADVASNRTDKHGKSTGLSWSDTAQVWTRRLMVALH